jgi:hypothetical protein
LPTLLSVSAAFIVMELANKGSLYEKMQKAKDRMCVGESEGEGEMAFGAER